ncbi:MULTISPECIES: hypothetical protein [unclassified Streptomyces]|nr:MULTISPECIES: hypothetical protein [unclassified Streptomyces]TXS71504.1 hypothetical protein EAO69_22170 [Streptomyces sp. me109]
MRHGGGQKDVQLTRIEALGVVRAAAVWIVMLINLDKEGRFQAHGRSGADARGADLKLSAYS